MARFQLDDGSVVEDLKVVVGGAEYQGSLTIRRVDRTKSAFDVSFRDLYHKDPSLFHHASVEQMRLHARFVLERLVQNGLEEARDEYGGFAFNGVSRRTRASSGWLTPRA